MNKRYILSLPLAIIMLLIPNIAFAQQKHEVSVGGTMGFNSLNYKTNNNSFSSNFSGSGNVGYLYLLNQNWGVYSGLEVSIYKGVAKENSFVSVLNDLKDEYGEVYDLHSEVKNYNEKQKLTTLNIPIMAQYQTEGKHKFYTLGGAKIGIPLKAKYNGEGSFINKGYFHDLGIWMESQEFMSFGSFKDKKSDGDLKLKTSFMLAAEVGGKFELSENIFLYLGMYIDYGLNNILKKQKGSFLIHDLNAPYFTNNSILESDNKKEEFTDKVRIISSGLKVRLSFEL